jgi:hypothetical protein
MLVADQAETASLLDDQLEKLSRRIVVEQSAAIMCKAAVVKARFIAVHVEEPAEQQIVVELLTKQPITADTIKCHQQRSLEQPLGRNRRSPGVAVHSAQQPGQFDQRRVSQGLNPAQRMIGRHPLFRRSQTQHRGLAVRFPSHPRHLRANSPLTVARKMIFSVFRHEGFSTPC